MSVAALAILAGVLCLPKSCFQTVEKSKIEAGPPARTGTRTPDEKSPPPSHSPSVVFIDRTRETPAGPEGSNAAPVPSAAAVHDIKTTGTLRKTTDTLQAHDEGKGAGSGKEETGMTQEQILEIAHAARGSMKYSDKQPITIEHVPGQYIVTFPCELPKGRLGADYAMRVWIDDKTGKVVKALGGS